MMVICRNLVYFEFLILKYLEEKSKIQRLTNFSMMAAAGDASDSLQFTDFIVRNMHLYKIINSYHMSIPAVVHFTRTHLASFLRCDTQRQLNLLLGGFDPWTGPELHYIDRFGSSTAILFGGHGAGIKFCGPIFDTLHSPYMDQREAYCILEKCVGEIQRRLWNQRNFDVFVMDQQGITQWKTIKLQSFRKELLLKDRRKVDS